MADSTDTHARYLDYRERFVYFGRQTAILSLVDFSVADKEQRALRAQPRRSDDDDDRLTELTRLLFRD